MKHTKKTLMILTIVLASTFVRGQNGESFKDMYLKGKWTASCPPEILDQASMHTCELCSFTINPNDKIKGSIGDIEMNFLVDSISFNQNGTITTVPYKKNLNNHSISFILNNKTFNFRMFLDGQRRILVDSDGMIMVLKK